MISFKEYIEESSNVIKSFSQKTGKSEIEIEKLWKEAKEIALKQKSKNDPMFFGLVTTILKNKLGLK